MKENVITWIEGQNSTGKTILVKKLLGATFTPKDFIPLEIIKNPLDIENDFPDRLVPSEFVFYYDIIMPKHVTFISQNSQIHIFLGKVRGNAKERNRIFRLYDKFLIQNNTIKEKERHIKELDNEIKSVHEQYHAELHQYQVTKKELEEKLEKINHLSDEMKELSNVDEFGKYQKLLDIYMNSKYIKKQVKSIYEPLHNEVIQYRKQYEEIIAPLCEEFEKLYYEKKKIGNYFDLINKLEEHKKDIPETPRVIRRESMLRHLKSKFTQYKKKIITKEDILELVKNFSSQKNIWIDGKPSSHFEEFYNLIELIGNLSPDELFISHCGNKMWFNNAFRTPYRTSQGDLTLNLSDFKNVWIEVPSTHGEILISDKKDQIQL